MTNLPQLLADLEAGKVSATAAQEHIEKYIRLCYEDMQKRIDRKDDHLSYHQNELRRIHQGGMFDSLKIWFSEDLERIGLGSMRSCNTVNKN